MKKRIAAILVVSMIFSACFGAFAEYDPAENPMTVIPETDMFSGNGEMFSKEVYQEWLDKGLTENVVHSVLDGNYAFVANQNNYWTIDRKNTYDKNTAVLSDDGVFSIDADLCEKLFGITSSKEYIPAADIVKSLDGYKYFVDSRGFCIFSKNLDAAIDKNPVSLEKYNGQDAVQYGSYYPVGIAIGEITWNDVDVTEADFEKYISNWENTLLQLDKISKHEDYVAWLVGQVSGFLEIFDESNPTGFSDGNQYQAFLRCRYMAECYRTLDYLGRDDIDRELLKTRTLALMRILYDNMFSKNDEMLKPTNNWFNTKIVYPYNFGDALMLMRGEVTPEVYQKYVNAGLVITVDPQVGRFNVPPKKAVIPLTMQELINQYSNYTNLLWCSHASIRWAALAHDSYRMNRYFKYLSQIFELNIKSGNYNTNTIRDGIFEDGSFKFHNYFAYNLGYGNSYACEIAELLETTADTPFDIRKIYGYNNIYHFIENAWAPFIYNGNLSKIVMGREEPTDNNGKAMIMAIMIIASYAPDDVRERLLNAIKPAIGERMDYFRDIPERIPGYYSFIWPTIQERINGVIETMDSMDDSKSPEYSRVYYNMDKVVHKKQDFTFMLSLSSERIGRYEAINQQSYDDWYIGSGMTYVMTDTKQFGGDWWHLVDRYRIPGTTVDEMEQLINSEYGLGMPENSWAGAVTDGEITAASMQLPGNWRWADTRLVGNKSYFMTGDKIVCLGSDIKGGKGNTYTIIDNLMLDKKSADGTAGTEETYVGEAAVTKEFDKKELFDNPEYIWFEGGRGYVMLGDMQISAERVKNTKKYSGIAVTNTPNDTPFMTLMIEHGEIKKTGSYGYVILPCATREETAAYSKNVDFEILRQDSVMHAIKLKDSGIVMANIFKPAELEGFGFVTPCAVILKPQSGGYMVYVAEPTQKAHYVRINLPQKGSITENTSAVAADGNSISIKVDDHYGKTYSFGYNLGSLGAANQSPDITVRNMRIRVSDKKVSTNLNAVCISGKKLHFTVLKQPENGAAKIKDGVLEYTPKKPEQYTDEVIVAAENDSGGCSEFKIVFEK